VQMNGEMAMSGRLKGKVSLVAGGSRRLGAATAKVLAGQGATFNSLRA
jgi:NAD(P)-dependent dehydrogenase (short-subunit alcohol dehydrogenase family)